MTRVNPSFQSPISPIASSPIVTAGQNSSQSTLSSSKNQGCSLLSPIYAVADFLTWLLQTIFCCFDYTEKGQLFREFVSFKAAITHAKEKCEPNIDRVYDDLYRELADSTKQVLQECSKMALEERLKERPQLMEGSASWKDLENETAIDGQLTFLGELFAKQAFDGGNVALANLINRPHTQGGNTTASIPYEDLAYAALFEIFKLAEARLNP
ncbi:MAG: hypothetical protein K940chlam2_01021 [Chlamydiae bacterium]|nr:hypothetical protein [Chlamydiota bacterium]